MNIVTGSGNRRKVFVFPCSEIVNWSPETQQKAAASMLCKMLNVSEEVPA